MSRALCSTRTTSMPSWTGVYKMTYRPNGKLRRSVANPFGARRVTRGIVGMKGYASLRSRRA